MICPKCNKHHDSDHELTSIFNNSFTLCYKCYLKFNPILEHFKIDNVNALALFEYNDAIKELLFQLKGQSDIKLAPIFIERFLFYLSILYEGYTLTYVPSYLDDDLKRGFNHVELIFEKLKLKKCKLFIKKEKYKQSDIHFSNRHLIKNVITISDKQEIPKKILLVDDVLTSGFSVKTCLELLRTKGVKSLKVLIMSKVCRYMSNDFF